MNQTDAGRCPEVQGMLDRVPARGPLRVRALLRPARGSLHGAALRRGRAQAPHPGGPADPLALRGLPAAGRARRRAPLPTGWTPLVRADRLAERLGLREVWVKNETANPTHSFKDRVVSVALARAQELGFDTIACASTGNLANAVAAHAAAAGPARPTSSSRPTSSRRRSSRRAPTGPTSSACAATTTTSTASARRSPASARAGRSSTSTCARTTPRAPRRWPSRSPSSSASSSRPRRRADRLRLAVHEGRPRLSGVDRLRAARRRRCRASTAPRRSAARRSRRRGTRAPTSAARSSRTRSPSRWRSATRPTARTRSSSPRTTGGVGRRVTDDEIRAGIRLLAETTGIFTETAGGVTTATLAKLAERGDIDPDERVVLLITGDGLKTLDSVRDGRSRSRRSRRRWTSSRRRSPG